MVELRLKAAALRVSAICCAAALVGLLVGCGGKNDAASTTATTTAGPNSVGGIVSGMDAGTSMVLRNLGVEDLTISANGSFTFATKLADLAAYNVIIITNPAKKVCSLGSASGTIPAATNVTTIQTLCYPSSMTVSTLAGSLSVYGSADGTGTAATFNTPIDAAVDTAGNVYIVERINNTIRKVTPAGVVSTFAGTAGALGTVDGVGTAARFNAPTGIAMGGDGNIYVADTGNNTIRRVTPAGVVSTIAGTAGTVGSADGVGAAALFFNPARIAVDASSNLYVTDRGNSTIRKITPSRIVTTLAGTPGMFGSADGTGSAASFFFPIGVAADTSGNVYVGDGTNTIRKITQSGVVSTLAGTSGVTGAADGTGALASFNNIGGIAVDVSGNIFVADQGNNLIRKVTPSGVVTLFSGIWGRADSADGSDGTAGYRTPTSVAVDGKTGNMYVTDYTSSLIRKITLK